MQSNDSIFSEPPVAEADKLILKCGFSPGDIVMLTAAVRDLHLCYPKRFLTDVRTLCPDLWENNPHITPLRDDDGSADVIDCRYPLINRCDTTPYHCLHGFAEFLSERLNVQIKLSAFGGDIHLAAQEKAWYSQVHEVTGEDTPFWIVSSGGKYDVTVKWWSPERYQRVIDYFRKKIVFVQVGQRGHHHPKIEGAIDLRGRTTLRELTRLVYHADGVLSPVTCLMHMAAAVEWKRNRQALRPCVVIAGGREPAHWEQYPGHQFIHTIGSLNCCAKSGCWRDRTTPLGDGDPRDQSHRLCLSVMNNLPRCLDLITVDEVVHRIETYYSGGALEYLTPQKWHKARRGIRATDDNPFDQLPLTVANARIACERAIRSIPEYPDRFAGRGIVICGGGCRYFTNAWACIKMLRQFGCELPVELWYLGVREMDAHMISLVKELGVECIDAFERRKEAPCRILGGWELKCFAILHSAFEEVMLLDADNVPVRNPEYLFDERQYRETGAVFWPDVSWSEGSKVIWRLLGMERPSHAEFESGQILVNKRTCWKALNLSLWLNENSDFFYRYLHGDKETFHLAFRKLNQPFVLVATPVQILPGTMCQHDLEGRRLFQHRNTDKWNLFARNPKVAGFWHEEDCRRHLVELQQRWSGRIGSALPQPRKVNAIYRRPLSISGGMVSSQGREEFQGRTLQNLSRTDWPGEPLLFVSDDGEGGNSEEQRLRTTLQPLSRFLDGTGDYLLYMEDALEFNRYLHHNVQRWLPILTRAVTLASLYNPGILEESCDVSLNAYVVRADHVSGSEAFLISRPTARYMAEHWLEAKGAPDVRMAKLAGRLTEPIYYHSPSLVQRVRTAAEKTAAFHQAVDFSPDWKS